ncbi:MAG: glycosyltransferase [Planctomycetota bacterium]|nr:glycosyltransferase [Planctomycetota bacterium]
MKEQAPLVLVANTRLPAERAQALQVSHAAAAFARLGVATHLLHARRRREFSLPAGQDLWSHYGVAAPGGHPRPRLEALPCLDWIESVPPAVQYLPARLQELSFARRAARRVLALAREHHERTGGGAGPLRLLARELEVARFVAPFARGAHAVRGASGVRGAGSRSAGAAPLDLFLEVHRVPGGRLRRSWLRQAARAASGVLAISEGVRADLIDLGLASENIAVEHDAFEPALIPVTAKRDAARAAAREALGLDQEAPVVVYTGGLLAWKGVDIAVAAARSLPAVTFLIVGGMEQDVVRLRSQAGALDNLRIEGFQAPARVPLYLAAADLGLVPNLAQPAISARYTSPLKIFESMAAGLPLLVSDLPSLREILDESEARFFPAGDADALVAAITELLGDAPRRAAMTAAMVAAAPQHTWERRAERILAWMGERAASPLALNHQPGGEAR